MSNQQIKLYGRAFVLGEIEARSGLHIGGAAGALEIGGLDMPVIRDVFGVPYIPGSSLKGKMRSLWEKWTGAAQNRSIGRDVTIHMCEDAGAVEQCAVCPTYGTMGQHGAPAPTRLTVRDVPLDESSLEGASTTLPFAEVKWEAAIDRVTSAATPRQLERVPAGAIFRQEDGTAAEILVFSFYQEQDIARFGDLLTAMQLVEDDYLGGQGSRGSGRVGFRKLAVVCKGQEYDQPETLVEGAMLAEIIQKKAQIEEGLRRLLGFAAEG